MTKRRQLMLVTAVGVVVLSIGCILLSPLSRQIFRFDGSVNIDNVTGLLFALITINATFILAVVSVCACFQLAKRLGYDPMLGLALLCPGVNLVIFYYIAFRESPVEAALRRERRRGDGRTDPKLN